MEITVIGSGTVVPRLARRQSCAVVEAGEENIVLDLGNGAVRGMLRTNIDPFAVDRVFFTHFHPDHTSDIVPLLFALKYGAEEERERPFVLYGPEPFEDFFGSIIGVWGDWLLDGFLEISELPHSCPSPLGLPDLSVAWAPAEHNPESIAYRLEAENGALVYTGDTEYSESVVGLARGAHTLLIECSFPDNSPVPGHLTPKGVARIANESKVGRVVLTHIYPPADAVNLVQEVGKEFDGEVAVAEDGTRFSV
ncbi:MAG: MBL fold metallo-hydrolase [Actinomycetota bacterium]|jgi:ribonuclease BN (tRNA processing enzyme)|nr:MBL fold metallo-hydrolase [Actinomycetota bacterium]